MLDQVLLVICVVAPLIFNMFSAIAVIAGEDNKEVFWYFTLIYPIIDELQLLLQVRTSAAKFKSFLRAECYKQTNKIKSKVKSFKYRT